MGDMGSRFHRLGYRRHFFQHAGFRMVRSKETTPTPARLCSAKFFILGAGVQGEHTLSRICHTQPVNSVVCDISLKVYAHLAHQHRGWRLRLCTVGREWVWSPWNGPFGNRHVGRNAFWMRIVQIAMLRHQLKSTTLPMWWELVSLYPHKGETPGHYHHITWCHAKYMLLAIHRCVPFLKSL